MIQCNKCKQVMEEKNEINNAVQFECNCGQRAERCKETGEVYYETGKNNYSVDNK